MEFGLASSTAKVIRQVLDPAYSRYDGKMINRLNSAVSACIRNSSSKGRGDRDLHDGHLACLDGFQFNAASPLHEELQYQPECCLREDGKLLIRLPAQQLKRRKSHYRAEYTLRLLVTAIDFRQEWTRYLKHEDITLAYNLAFEGREWLVEDIPAGNIILVSLSLQATEYNSMHEPQSLNTKEWSPSAILAAYSTGGQEPELQGAEGKATYEERREAGYIVLGSYFGNQILQAILLIREGHLPTGSERSKIRSGAMSPPVRKQENTTVLPTGKVSFKDLK